MEAARNADVEELMDDNKLEYITAEVESYRNWNELV